MSADTFVALAAQILAERLAKEPQRVQELVAAAEQSAWAAAQAHLQDALLAAILDQVTRQAANVATASLPATGVSMPTPPVAQPEPAQPELAQREPVQPEPAPPKALPAPEPPTPAPLHESGVGIYVYGIIDDPSLVLPALAGMTDGKLVRLYPYRSLAALVCEVPLDEFGQAAIEANLADMTWLERRVRAHQGVLDAVLPLATLLPMKFATIYFDMARLDNLFEEQFEEFETVLEHLRGHQEWGVKVYIDQALLLEHIDDYSSAVQELRAEMHSKSQGAAYFLARRLQEVVTEEFERVSFAVADETHGSLGDLSRATLLSALPPAAPDEAERLVLSGVYLVAQANTTPFAAAVDELAERHAGHGFRLEISGPWPAYNFVDLAWLQEERS